VQRLINNSWKKDFSILWGGQFISMLTSAVVHMSIIWHITATTGSALYLSLSFIAGFLPNSLFGLFAGTLVDRMQRKAAMITADLFIAAVTLILVFSAMDGDIEMWVIMVVLVLRSIGTAFHSPAINATVPLIVPKRHLRRCAGYTNALTTFGFMVGTAVAGVLYPILSMSWLVFMDVAGAIVACVAVLFIRVPTIDSLDEKSKEKYNAIKEFKEGFEVMKSDKGVFSYLCVGTVFLIVYSPVSTLFPLMSLGYFGGTTMHAAAAEMCFSAGLIFGGVLLGKTGGFKDRGFGLVFAIALMGMPICISGLLPQSGFWVFATMCVIMGISGPLYTGPVSALMQERIPQEYMGRAFGMYASLSSLAMPVGMAAAGVFAEDTGVAKWFVIAGAACALLAVIAWMIPSVRNIERGESK